MNTENYVPVQDLCAHYKIEISFIDHLKEFGLIEIMTSEQLHFIHHDNLSDLEKMIRLHHELDLNMEGLDTVLHLLKKIEVLHTQLKAYRNRLLLYEAAEL